MRTVYKYQCSNKFNKKMLAKTTGQENPVCDYEYTKVTNNFDANQEAMCPDCGHINTPSEWIGIHSVQASPDFAELNWLVDIIESFSY